MAMKDLYSIYEKLSIDDIIDVKEFPIDGTIEDMIEFLEKNGFVPADESHNYEGSVDDIFNYNKSRCFLKENTGFWFTDTSKEKISKKNPIFYVSMVGTLSRFGKKFNVYYCDSNVGSGVINIVKDNKERFLRELNKRFGWQ